jgi:hypothetical protein
MLQKVCLKTSWRKGVSNWLGVEDWFYFMRCWTLSLLWFLRALFIEQEALCTLICICSLCHYRFIAKGWFANTHCVCVCVCVCGVQVLREIQEQYQQKMTQLCAKQAKQCKEFLHNEADMCYQQPLPTGCGHSYTQSEPSYTDSLPYDHMITQIQISHTATLQFMSYNQILGWHLITESMDKMLTRCTAKARCMKPHPIHMWALHHTLHMGEYL